MNIGRAGTAAALRSAIAELRDRRDSPSGRRYASNGSINPRGDCEWTVMDGGKTMGEGGGAE